jgi:hypothetical protein
MRTFNDHASIAERYTPGNPVEIRHDTGTSTMMDMAQRQRVQRNEPRVPVKQDPQRVIYGMF